ncbi:hypothetical protein [Actinokineospora baliensis]|uniref:hypothetical protein n=1 Tax=Actinokineospora baliensis TaxID=547056 RepID=UPI00195691FF|nr:hypothetical protein [Actinokineospora baliensis]
MIGLAHPAESPSPPQSDACAGDALKTLTALATEIAVQDATNALVRSMENWIPAGGRRVPGVSGWPTSGSGPGR